MISPAGILAMAWLVIALAGYRLTKPRSRHRIWLQLGWLFWPISGPVLLMFLVAALGFIALATVIESARGRRRHAR